MMWVVEDDKNKLSLTSGGDLRQTMAFSRNLRSLSVSSIRWSDMLTEAEAGFENGRVSVRLPLRESKNLNRRLGQHIATGGVRSEQTNFAKIAGSFSLMVMKAEAVATERKRRKREESCFVISAVEEADDERR